MVCLTEKRGQESATRWAVVPVPAEAGWAGSDEKINEETTGVIALLGKTPLGSGGGPGHSGIWTRR